MFEIKKTFSFAASHQLLTLPETHKCHRLHGHNYKVTVTLRQEYVDQHGFVLDYGALDFVKKWLDDNCDHRHLNDVFIFEPSAENIARYMYGSFASMLPDPNTLYCLTVSETDNTEATFYGKF